MALMDEILKHMICISLNMIENLLNHIEIINLGLGATGGRAPGPPKAKRRGSASERKNWVAKRVGVRGALG